jgi:hypothetical protein
MNQPQLDPNVYGTTAMDASDMGVGMGVYIVGGMIYLWLIVFMTCAMIAIFIKADKPWWAAIVPIYNIVILMEIVGKPLWWIILFFIPLANFVALILVTNSLSKSFGKDVGYTVGLVLLGIVFYPMLAFGSSQYRGPAG